ncbi:MAG: DUF5719 family protein [Actinomycetota bacterium]|nr:DUF5719 family protein [Actinomycetota bacterium]
MSRRQLRVPRPDRRRVARHRVRATGPHWPLAVVLVLVTAAGLWWAGTSPHLAGTRTAATKPVAVSGRTFSCTGGVPGAVADHGHLGTPVTSTTITAPVKLSVSGGAVASAYAVQSARSARWLAYGACPEPRSDWWFVGVGSSSTHHTVLTVANPRAGEAIFDVSLSGPKGPVNAPGLRGLAVRGGASRSLDLAKLAPAPGDLAVHLTTSRGLVSVAAAEQRSAGVLVRAASEWVPAEPGPGRHLLVTGLPGLTAKRATATLLLANPAKRVVIASVSLVDTRGTFTPSGQKPLDLPPEAVVSVPLSRAFTAAPGGVSVRAQEAVVAAVRSVAGGDEGYAATGRPLSGTSVAGVPAKVSARVVLSSLNRAAAVAVTGYDASGRSLGSHRVVVPARGSASLPVSARARSVAVATSTGGPVVGSVVVQDAHGTASTPLASVPRELLRPVVRPGW